MSEDNSIMIDGLFVNDSIPEGYRSAQRALDCFAEINSEVAIEAALLHTDRKGMDVGHIEQQIVDIIRNNPPLQTVPLYFRDGRSDYLWYSDFYDDAGNDVFRCYGEFVAPPAAITPANYATELAKVDLPYFKELVNLISLEKLYAMSVGSPVKAEPVTESQIETPSEKSKRSYEPKLAPEQYSLLTKCVEKIELFRRPVDVSVLRSLFAGELAEPLQVNNQKTLTYLLDQLAGAGLIKKTWITVADRNRDFISFLRGKNAERYGNGRHFITAQQFANCRSRNEREYVEGLGTIEDMIERIKECGK